MISTLRPSGLAFQPLNPPISSDAGLGCQLQQMQEHHHLYFTHVAVEDRPSAPLFAI
jgi:hypothetical protein